MQSREPHPTTRLITLNGKTQCAAAWIKELGISKSTFYKALHKGQTYFISRYCPDDHE